MPRRPEPSAKIPQIIIRAVNVDEEKKIKAMKEIIARNPDLTITTTRTKKGEGMKLIERFLAAHNWPPGNSQTQLATYGCLVQVECCRCHEKFPENKMTRVEFISGLSGPCCDSCLAEAEEKTTVKHKLGPI